jgi:hypothetical protein
MLQRYIKAQLMVLLCGGLVGPIFLIVYFATGQDPLMKWMFYAGIFATAVDVLVALGLANYGSKSAAKKALLEQQGVLALAQITGLTETGTRINDQPLVKVNLRISAPGLTPFDAQDRVLASVTRLPVITGRQMVVLVDPTTQEFQIDWERSALVAGAVPAQFTLAEDNRTYDLSGQAAPLMEIMQILKANNIPLSGMIDLRSNLAVRQQVIGVVRRTAGQAAAAAPAGPPQYVPPTMPKAPEPSIAQRLQELETLRATGTITEAEYAEKRKDIIADL